MPILAPEQNMLTRLSAGMLQQFRTAGFWGTDTIYDCCRKQAERAPNSVALRDSCGPLSYEDLRAAAERVAADLRAAGLHPGDRVAAWMSPRADVAVLLVACSLGGFILCPSLHKNHTVAEIITLLRRMRAKAFYYEPQFGANAAQHDIAAEAREITTLRRIVPLAAPVSRSKEAMIADLAGAGDSASCAPPAPRADGADDIVYLAFTSGTTGEPKGVMHTNNTLLANARSMAADWGFDAHSVTYTMGPLSHNLGFGALVLTLLMGGELVLHSLPRGASLVARLREVGATFLFGVPAHAMDLLTEIGETATGGSVLPRLKGFRISGAAVPSWVVERLAQFGITSQSGYGMTEACSHHYTLPGDAPERISQTSGRACPGYEVKVFSAEDPDKELPTGEVGHIGGRGASLMMGYFDDQTATEKSFNRDGWFMTGDLGRLDADGYLTLTGRLKEIIIRGGHNIHPAHIEKLAMRHPRVERAAAIAVPDERLGEKVCLVVMSKDGAPLEPDDILAHLDQAGLSRYDMPEYLLNAAIPLSASGKMLKRALLPDIASGALKPQPVRFRPVQEAAQ